MPLYPSRHSRYSRHCETCDIHWPDQLGFKACPGCLKLTYIAQHPPLEPGPAADLRIKLTEERAAREANHVAFERHCAERDEALVQELVGALNRLPTAAPWLDAPPGEVGC